MSPISGVIEKCTEPIFDTIYLPEELRQSRALMFVTPLGMMIRTKNGSVVKTEHETNLYQCGMLDAPRQMQVQSIDCHFVDEIGIVPAQSRWYAEATLEFSVNRKTYCTSTLAKVVSTAALLDTKTLLEKQQLLTVEDIAKLKDIYQTRFETPVLIEQQQNFSVKISFSEWCRWSSRSAPEKLVVYLNGEQYRAVL